MTYNYFCLPGLLAHEKIHIRTPTIDIISSAVESVFGIKEGSLMIRTRRVEIVLARQMTMWINIRRYNRTTIETGRFFNMDHSTAIHSCRAIDNYIQTEPDTKAKLEAIINKLNWS